MPFQLPKILNPDAEGQAVRVLKHYFKPLEGRNQGFTGGCWDTFDPSETRAASANRFTADDIVACTLLSAPIPGRAAVELLEDPERKFSKMLEAIREDREFVELKCAEKGSEFDPVHRLCKALDDLPGIGETRATKLLARKRPRLVPIVDTVVRKHVFQDSPRQWQPLLEAVQADDGALWKRLVHLRGAAKLDHRVSVLRVFDVLAWMEGSGNAAKLNQPIVAPDEPPE